MKFLITIIMLLIGSIGLLSILNFGFPARAFGLFLFGVWMGYVTNK